jgi:hypothetical protein
MALEGGALAGAVIGKFNIFYNMVGICHAPPTSNMWKMHSWLYDKSPNMG